MSRLQSVTIDSFKGSTNEVTVEFANTNLTVIYGENGTGKSSIVDAFDVICNNNAGSLEEKSISSPKSKYLINLRKKQRDCKVKLTYNNLEWTSTLGSKYHPDTLGDPNIPKASILRRDKILDFITKQPAPRYEAIKSFIDTPQCEKIESFINQLKIDYEKESENSISAIADAEDALNKLWELEGRVGANYSVWAQQKTSRSSEELQMEINAYSSIQNSFAQLKSQKENYDRLLTSLRSTEEEQQVLNQEFDILSSQAESNITELIDVLRTSKNYIEKTPTIDLCPVCEQGVEREALLNSVNDRMTTKKQFIDLKDKLLAAQRRLDITTSQIGQSKPQLIEKASLLYNALVSFIPVELQSNNFILESYSDLTNAQTLEDDKIHIASILFESLNVGEQQLRSHKSDSERTLNNLNAISSHVSTIKQKRNNAAKLDLMKQRITSLYNLFVEERKLYIKEVLESVSDDIDRIYSSIHPNENLGNVKLCPDESRRASIELKSSFEGANNIQPQAYYSESHLDTLGICLFIALAKKFKTDDTILIFDDVITSADQVHLTRFLRMLEGELQHFQHTVITTHYQIWRDKYRYGNGNVQLVELLRWTLDRGIRHTKTKLYIEELRVHLSADPFDKQIVASKSGIFLELILDNLALMYKCKLPRKAEPFYTLGEFLGAFDSSLKKRIKIEIVDGATVQNTIQLVDLFNVLPADSNLRNQVGCHFNIIGENFTEVDVTDMANNTLQLANALICDNCGELPYKNRSGIYYECKCNKKRLYPFND
jgi:ABC-type transport system involved in cytochrome c biogenesis ATPase subunit